MKDRILSALKSADGYVSGEELSHSFGITRSAVWKHIAQLKEDGYNIDSVRNRGYKLENVFNMIDESKVIFNAETVGKKLIVLKSTDSTNSELKRLARDGEQSGTVVCAYTQTAGKGRFGRQWQSDKGGLYFSFLLKADLPPSHIASITLASGYAVCLAVREHTGLDVRIKWPNDIIIDNRKICGILTEMAAQSDRMDYIITGIGINVNNAVFPEEIRHKATSLFIETGKMTDKSDFFLTVLKYLDKVLTSFLVSISLEDMENFKKLCATLGREVYVQRGDNTLTGTAVDITPFGELVIETQEHKTVSISSGEVTVQGIY